MNWRAFVQPDLSRMGQGVSVYLGRNRHDGQWDVVQPVQLVAEQHPEGVETEPTFRLDEDTARALLDALAAHYGGTSDVRQLRRDYDAERARVDRLLNALVLPIITRETS